MYGGTGIDAQPNLLVECGHDQKTGKNLSKKIIKREKLTLIFG